MKTNRLILILLALVIITVIIVLIASNKYSNPKNSSVSQTIGSVFPPQTNSEGSVSVTVTPQVLGKGKATQFDLTFTTHMGSLNNDLIQVSELNDDQGNVYKAVNWNGGQGGHHLQGTLSFPVLSEKSTKVTLTLSNIDSVDRVFSWDLK